MSIIAKIFNMFGNDKKFAKATRGFLIAQLGLDEDSTDAEITEAVSATEKKAEAESKEDKTKDKPKSEEKPDKAEEAETDVKKELEALKKDFKALSDEFEEFKSDSGELAEKVAKIEKFQGRNATGGKRDVEEPKKKGEYTEKDAPRFDD
jgi:predicted RNase H-like nuclease (RuvC/YqgF family)